MKTLVSALVLFSSAVCYAGQEPTVAEPAADKTESVVVKSDCNSDCSDCKIRRRGLFGRRGYVIDQVSVQGNQVVSTRKVLDGCCNTVRTITTVDSCDACCGRSRTIIRRGRCCGCTSSCGSCE